MDDYVDEILEDNDYHNEILASLDDSADFYDYLLTEFYGMPQNELE